MPGFPAEVQGKMWGTAPDEWTKQEQQHIPLFEAAIKAVGIADGTKVLDAGCGAGTCSELAQSRGAAVTGLDASEGLLGIARKRSSAVEFVKGDINALGFDDNVFDAVIAMNSIQYGMDPAKTMGEFVRVTKPGGKVIAAMFAGPPPLCEIGVVFKAMMESMPEPPPPGGGGPFGLSDKVGELMTAAGVTAIAAEDIDTPWSYPDDDSFWQSMRCAGPVQLILTKVDEGTLRRNVMAAIEPFKSASGIKLANKFRLWTGTVN